MIWKVIGNLRYFLQKCKKDKINAYAAQSAFFIILSAIPFLMFFSSLLRYTTVTKGMLLNIITQVMPEYISPFMISLVDEVYNRSVGIISVTAVMAVWSAAKGIQYMADGLNAVHNIEEKRNWFVLRFWAVVYTAVFTAAIVATLLILVFGNSIHKLVVKTIPIFGQTVAVFTHFKGMAMLAILILFFDILFTTLPNRKLTFKGQLPGAAICGVAWYLYSFGLSVYVDYFNGFSMYGSLTTIALIMLWLYFCMYIMMISAEINVVFNDNFQEWQRKRKDKKYVKKGN